jgi:hypothetical protein
MDAQASPAKKADDPPKSPQLKHVTIRNDDGGKATCALGYEGKFDNAGLTITYDSAHASDGAVSRLEQRGDKHAGSGSGLSH